jgi:hypothetical protein
MARSSYLRQAEVELLLDNARSALVHAEQQRALNLCQRAAMLDPYQERVWLLLLNLVTTLDDKRVCAMNILVLNPENAWAHMVLNEAHSIPLGTPVTSETAPLPRPRAGFKSPRPRWHWWR